MFGQFTDGKNSNYMAEIEGERRERLKEKMRRDIDRIHSSGSSEASSHSTITTDTDDSVERLRKLKEEKRENAKLRRERRIKREKKLRDKMKKLDKLEKNLRNSSGNAGVDGAMGALAGLGGGSSTPVHSIDAVAHVLRALKKSPAQDKSDGTPRQPEPFSRYTPPGAVKAFVSPAAVDKTKSSESSSPSSSSKGSEGSNSDEEKKDQAKDMPSARTETGAVLDREALRNKFRRAVNKAKMGNRVMDDLQRTREKRRVTALQRSRRAGVQVTMNEDGMAEIGDLVSSINSKMEDEERRRNMSGLAKFLSGDLSKVHHDDFDSGVNAMALLCALVLSVPYQIAGSLDYSNLDWMKGQIDVCTNEWTYGFVYTGYRSSFVITVYFSIGGMIMATFYFLFKRNDDFDYKIWRNKARILVILLFFSTALAIIGLILLTNLYFDYFLLSSTENICSNGTMPYFMTGCGVSLAAFIGAFWLIL